MADLYTGYLRDQFWHVSKYFYLTKILGQDGITRCGLVLNPEIYLTYPVKKRPFQGWRYLKEEDAPKDYEKFAPGNDVIPTSLKLALSELGII